VKGCLWAAQLKRHYHEDKAKRWLAFLSNHREVIAAFDFFTVPTITFRVVYCFFVIEHDRRRILHFNATAHPTSDWVVQQLREALPLPCRYQYVVFDRDAKFGGDVFGFLKASGLTPGCVATTVFRLLHSGTTSLKRP
jgi:hypothetical protein